MRSAIPETRYARSGDVNIAYQVSGGGPFDLMLVQGFVSHLDVDWDEPGTAHFLRRLGSFSRLIRFDKRGTGLSDRPGGLPDLETRMDDVRAVMDAVGSEQAALLGYSEGGPMCCLFAATYPERTSALVLYGAYAKRQDPDGDYPWAATSAERRAYADEIERNWGVDADLGAMAPTADSAMRAWWAKRARAAASPGAARDLILMNSVSIDPDEILDEVQEFLTGARPVPETERVLATVLFTDIVASTERAAVLGDRRWRELLERHNVVVRHELDRFRGREVDTAGDVPREVRRSRESDPLCSRDRGGDGRPGARASSGSAHRRMRAHGRQGHRCRGSHGRAGSPLWRSPARFSCPARSRTSSPAPGSNSMTAGRTP
jgi:pimeloyl-ACP methyl ester carboxylesterase